MKKLLAIALFLSFFCTVYADGIQYVYGHSVYLTVDHTWGEAVDGVTIEDQVRRGIIDDLNDSYGNLESARVIGDIQVHILVKGEADVQNRTLPINKTRDETLSHAVDEALHKDGESSLGAFFE